MRISKFITLMMGLVLQLLIYGNAVHAADSNAFRGPFIYQLEPTSLLLNNFVPSSAVHVKNHGISVFKDRLIFGPTVEQKMGFNTVNFLQD